MDFSQFVKTVQEEGNCREKEEAVKAIRATLQTLGERLFQGEAEQLAAQLPREIQPYLVDIKTHAKFHLDEFLHKVGEREGTDPQRAEQHARAVISVLCRAVSRGEIEDVISQLPKEYAKLFGVESRTAH